MDTAELQAARQEFEMVTAAATLSIYEPPSSGLPFLSVIIRPGQENNPLVTAFATLSEVEAFNREMTAEIIR